MGSKWTRGIQAPAPQIIFQPLKNLNYENL
jgi:hypothetical protein